MVSPRDAASVGFLTIILAGGCVGPRTRMDALAWLGGPWRGNCEGISWWFDRSDCTNPRSLRSACHAGATVLFHRVAIAFFTSSWC